MRRFKKLTSLLTAAALVLSLSVWGVFAEDGGTGSSASTTLNWSQFLGNEELQGVSDAKTPRTADEFEVKWTKNTGSTWNDTPGAPIIVGDYVYCYSSQYLHKYSLKDGAEVAKAQVFGVSTNQFMINLAYGDGKIFVPVKTNNMNDGTGVAKAHLRVFDADTLEQLYITEEFNSSDMQSPVMYHDGYVVTGGYYRNSYYMCFKTTDDDPTKSNEVKTAEWKVTSTNVMGFKWNGAAFAGDYVIFMDSAKSSAGSKVWSVNYKTGEIADEFDLPSKYQSQSTAVYNKANGRVYLASNNSDGNASIRSYEFDLSTGKFNLDESSIKEWKSGTKSGGTQSTPVIYNNRLYIAGGGGTMGSSEVFHVIDATTMTEIYKVDSIISKGSVVLTTGYATKENDNQVYLYIVPYSADKIFILSDKEGQTTPNVTSVPVGSNFCSQTVAIAKNGYLIWYQDDKNLYCCGLKGDSEITGTDVFNQIDRQPEVSEFKGYSEFELLRIKERYNTLSDEEKAKVTNLEKLEIMLKVANMSESELIDYINNGIANLPTTDSITLKDAETVEGLYKIYNQLSDNVRQQITDSAKLEAAYAKVQKLRDEALIEALIADIDKLPAADKLTLSDEGTVNALVSRLEALSAEDAAKVTNAGKLTAAKARIEKIRTQLSDLDDYINNNLAFADITLKSKDLLKGALKLTEGLAIEDINSISSYEQYMVPAMIDYVKLLIEKLYPNGKLIEVTAENAQEVSDTLAEIQKYYEMIPEGERRYISHYDEVMTLSEKAERFLSQNPVTGDSFAAGTCVTLMLLAGSAAALVVVKRRKRA